MCSEYLVQLRSNANGTYLIRFYLIGGGFDFSIEHERGILVEGGRWKSYLEASQEANDLINTSTPPRHENSLAALEGYKLIVTFCHEDKKWAIVGLKAPWKWEDSNMRFNSQREAREELARHAA